MLFFSAFVFLHIMEYILYIVIFFQLFNQLIQCFTLFGCHFFQIVRDTNKLAACDFVTVLFQIFLDSGVLSKFAVNNDFFFVFVYFIHSIIDQFQLQIFQRNTIFIVDMEYTFMIEQEFKATACTQ